MPRPLSHPELGHVERLSVSAPTTLVEEIQVRVEQRQEADPAFNRSHWCVEAFLEKLSRDDAAGRDDGATDPG